MKIMRRQDIENLCSIIEALRHKDISRMNNFDEDAIYDLGRVIDNTMLHRRAVEIMELVAATNFESLHSRNLWLNKEFMQIVNDLMNKIDLEVSKIDRLENKVVETCLNDTIGVGENTDKDTRNSIDINDIKLDKRWTRNTIPGHIRRLTTQADNLTDEEILNIVHRDEYIKELQSLNPLIKIR